MKIRTFTKPAARASKGYAIRSGGAGSLAEAMAGKARATASRYTTKSAVMCAWCRRNQHYGCTSIHCPCTRCNPEIL